MSEAELKTVLQRYLDAAREAILWKLEGLSEYDARRPLTPTGTNLLGLLKHVAITEAGYFGDVFGRPSGPVPAWSEEEGDDNADMWAAPDETIEAITTLSRRVREHTDATIAALPLDAAGRVPWWAPARQDVTLHQILIHMIAESHRHAGHADILRELIDGAAGLRNGNSNLPERDRAWWADYRGKLEQVARDAH
ncbi:hypothetical protein ART_0220 [Arthrobacter sp. PAMC 25486]|uniref:DinB family protein n=1 Tax=Arthrobacter sp. PAMC 25486 TaxID=1494608 RepID=UPI000535A934|nr:DinB family protein [Arthrobacter sp. PAMC 25486]AIX99818.1 hypothetical protein ART_0220 [Arthrobacter sp. PAMC 25486]